MRLTVPSSGGDVKPPSFDRAVDNSGAFGWKGTPYMRTRGRALIDRRRGRLILQVMAALTLCVGAAVPGFGQATSQHGADSPSWIGYWNQVAIDATGLDHTPVAPGEQRAFGGQLGPCRASRAIAIVQIAVFDVVNAISGGYHSYTNI